MSLALLEQITTSWTLIQDPVKFTLRYGTAVQRYLEVLLKDRHEAEEVAQDFLLRVVKCGFATAQASRGRFRDYLRVSLRHAVITHLRRRRSLLYGLDLDLLPQASAEADACWQAEWQRCLLERAWRSLERKQHRTGSLYYTVLRLAADHPEENARDLARRVLAETGQHLRPAALRQQLCRARRLFAGLLLDEVRQTLQSPSEEDLHDELCQLGLLPYLRPRL